MLLCRMVSAFHGRDSDRVARTFFDCQSGQCVPRAQLCMSPSSSINCCPRCPGKSLKFEQNLELGGRPRGPLPPPSIQTQIKRPQHGEWLTSRSSVSAITGFTLRLSHSLSHLVSPRILLQNPGTADRQSCTPDDGEWQPEHGCATPCPPLTPLKTLLYSQSWARLISRGR